MKGLHSEVNCFLFVFKMSFVLKIFVMYSQNLLVGYNPGDLYLRSNRAIFHLKSFVFYMDEVETQLTLQKTNKIKAHGSVTGGHKSKFLSYNCLVVLEKLSILSGRSHSRSNGFSLTYGANCQAFYSDGRILLITYLLPTAL